MNLSDFCGSEQFSILTFIIATSQEIQMKIKNKSLFYQEQINQYIEKQINLFLRNLYTNEALLWVYKREIYQSIMFRLKTTLTEHIRFRCVK